EEREERWEPQAAIPQPALSGQTVFTQTVRWLVDDRTILYTVGLPLSFDQPVRLHWRGREDFSRAVRVSAAAGPGARYEATSRLVTASPAELRAAAGEAIPDLILSRYTNLSEELPQRVRDLAQEVAGSHDNPYDKARALESFLRQYPYSLEVSSPPPGRDPVDYFLLTCRPATATIPPRQWPSWPAASACRPAWRPVTWPNPRTRTAYRRSTRSTPMPGPKSTLPVLAGSSLSPRRPF